MISKHRTASQFELHLVFCFGILKKLIDILPGDERKMEDISHFLHPLLHLSIPSPFSVFHFLPFVAALEKSRLFLDHDSGEVLLVRDLAMSCFSLLIYSLFIFHFFTYLLIHLCIH